MRSFLRSEATFYPSDGYAEMIAIETASVL